MDSTSSAKLSALSGLRNDIFMIPKYLSIICSEEMRDYGKAMTLIALSINLFL